MESFNLSIGAHNVVCSFPIEFDWFEIQPDGKLTFGPITFYPQANADKFHVEAHYLSFNKKNIQCVTWMLRKTDIILRICFENQTSLVGTFDLRSSFRGLLSSCVTNGKLKWIVDESLLHRSEEYLPLLKVCVCDSCPADNRDETVTFTKQTTNSKIDIQQFLFDEIKACIGPTNKPMSDEQFEKSKQLLTLMKIMKN